jgi:hypothetical protein
MLHSQVVLHTIVPEADSAGMPTTAPSSALALHDQAALRQNEIKPEPTTRYQHLLALINDPGIIELSRHRFF